MGRPLFAGLLAILLLPWSAEGGERWPQAEKRLEHELRVHQARQSGILGALAVHSPIQFSRHVPGVIIIQEPAGGAGENFTLRATCEGAWIVNDSDVSAGTDTVDDLCDDVTLQRGEDSLDSAGDVAATCGSAGLPTGSPAGDCYVAFDGTGDYLSLANGAGDADDFEAEDPITVGCWVYSTSTAVETDVINNSGSFVWTIRSRTDNLIEFGVENGADERISPDFENATWEHVVLRWGASLNSGAIHPFRNGVQTCSGGCTTETTSMTSDTGALAIGRKWFTTSDFTGRIYECAYFSTNLSDEEICQWCSCGLMDQSTNRNSSMCGSCDMGAGACSNN